jgi:acyl-CoA reductase-like NAD-dependent aldehyde dehydrogenase
MLGLSVFLGLWVQLSAAHSRLSKTDEEALRGSAHCPGPIAVTALPLVSATGGPKGAAAITVLELKRQADGRSGIGRPDELDQAVALAKKAFSNGRADRGQPGRRVPFSDLWVTHAEELALLEARNVGKPIGMRGGRRTSPTPYYAGAADKFFGETIRLPRPD